MWLIMKFSVCYTAVNKDQNIYRWMYVGLREEAHGGDEFDILMKEVNVSIGSWNGAFKLS